MKRRSFYLCTSLLLLYLSFIPACSQPSSPDNSLWGTQQLAATAQVVYVDVQSSSSTQNGTSLYPYHSIQKAIEKVPSGALIKVSPGMYNEGNIKVDRSVSIEGTKGLLAIVKASWQIRASGVTLRKMRFVGSNSGIGVDITHFGFTIEKCLIEDFNTAIFAQNVPKDLTIRHNRLINNKTGVFLFNVGTSTYALLENNIMIGQGSSYAIVSMDARFRALHNLFSHFSSFIHYQKLQLDLLTFSRVSGNVFINGDRPVVGYSVTPYKLRFEYNAYLTTADNHGIPASDQIGNIKNACQAPTSGSEFLYTSYVPSGACIDKNVLFRDADGSYGDLGPFGGPQGNYSFEHCSYNSDCPDQSQCNENGICQASYTSTYTLYYWDKKNEKREPLPKGISYKILDDTKTYAEGYTAQGGIISFKHFWKAQPKGTNLRLLLELPSSLEVGGEWNSNTVSSLEGDEQLPVARAGGKVAIAQYLIGPQTFYHTGWILVTDKTDNTAGLQLFNNSIRSPSEWHFPYATNGRAVVVGNEPIFVLTIPQSVKAQYSLYTNTTANEYLIAVLN